MTERQNAMTPTREERRLGQGRPFGWADSPFRGLQRFADEMDRMFDDFGLGAHWNAPFGRDAGTRGWAPQIDVFQENNELTIRADLPGMRKDEVSVNVTDDAITIQGERKRERQEEKEGFYRSERSYGSFRRVVPLPEGAITEQAKARFSDGVLEIVLPAPPAGKGRRLEITEGAKK